MKKNTPESFAKAVLWSLADIRAHLAQLQGFAATQISMLTNTDIEKVREGMAKEHSKDRQLIYRRLAVGAGLEEPTREELNRPPEVL